MGNLIKKGFYINDYQMEQLATVVYNSRKNQKRFVNESMVIRIGLDLLFNTEIDFTKYDDEQEIREWLRNAQITIKE